MLGWLAAGILLSSFVTQSAPSGAVPFSDGAWELRGDATRIVREDGRDVLLVETGYAFRRDVRLQDGTIEFDVKVTDRRSFVYLTFRMVADNEHEEIYLRPHKSNLPDALQYAPVWQGRSAWQLHHGPGGTAAVALEPGEWTHVRLLLSGRRAAVFVGDMTKPAMLVPHLAREPQAGYIALRGFLPAGVPGEGPIARYSNVAVRPGAVEFDFTGALKADAPAPSAGIVRAWSLSKSFVVKDQGQPTLPGPETLGEFERLETEPGGLLELHRHVKVPPTGSSMAVARLRVSAASAGTYAFDLGFSDIATVFVNGRAIFRGDASYSFDQPRREGLIGFDQARLYLPLVGGENVVDVLLTDTFGGWGIMGRFPSPEGLTFGGS